jgi:hypothetical protein
MPDNRLLSLLNMTKRLPEWFHLERRIWHGNAG